MVLRWYDLSHQVNDWDAVQPEVLEVNRRNSIIHDAYKKWQGTVNFKHNELCREGVLIEVVNARGEISQFLIGSINESGGVGSDHGFIDDSDIIKRCCVVWSKEKGKELSHE
jgi:hypothetical protein